MRASSLLSLRSRLLSLPSKPASSSHVKPGPTDGFAMLRNDRQEERPCLFDPASAIAREPAYLTGSRASPAAPKLGTKSAIYLRRKEQSSYFSPVIALQKKIISLGPADPPRSPDHERPDNGENVILAPLLIRHAVPRSAFPRFLGGRRRGDLRRAHRRGNFPARSLVTCN